MKRKRMFSFFCAIALSCCFLLNFNGNKQAQSEEIEPFIIVSNGATSNKSFFISAEINMADWFFPNFEISEITQLKNELLTFLQDEKASLLLKYKNIIEKADETIEKKEILLKELEIQTQNYNLGNNVFSFRLEFLSVKAFELFTKKAKSVQEKSLFIVKNIEKINSVFLFEDDISFQRKLINKLEKVCKNNLFKPFPNLISSSKEHYVYYNIKRRVHSNANKVSYMNVGRYCHEWEIEEGQNLDAKIYITQARGVYWYMLCMLISFSFLGIGLLIEKSKKVKSKKKSIKES